MASETHAESVHRSTARRKSCSQCIKTKRRCDLTLPRCTRCQTRGLACLYANDGNDHKDVAGTRSESCGAKDEIDGKQSGYKLGNAVGRFSSSYSGRASSPLAAGDPSPEDMDKADTLDAVASWLKTAEILAAETQDAATYLLTFPVAPKQVALSKRQTDYMVTHLGQLVKAFVLDNGTSFIHSDFYREKWPPVYQDARGVCSLYTQLSSRNRDVMFHTLNCKVDALIQESATTLSDVRGSLLALQMLVLYQVIRLFDGDVRQRANAERHLQLMDTWTLLMQQNYARELRNASGSSPYGSWLLAESIRRTTMMSVVLRSVFCTMRDGYCKLLPVMSTLPISRCSRLWKTTEKEWGRCSRLELLTYTEFVQEWNAGRISDVDEYERMLLVLCERAKRTEEFQPS